MPQVATWTRVKSWTLCQLILLGCVFLIDANSLVAQQASRSLVDAQNALQVRSGFVVQPVASEPLVTDPVSARLDYRGRLWVVEMPDYPLGPPDGAAPSGRIKILRDSDRDGRYDQATIFADNLVFATGVQPYRDGAFVTLAGQIVFMRDKDDDGQSDETSVLFTGFTAQNQQLRANHPTLGPDGMVYVAGGLRGGAIESVSELYPSSGDPIDLRDKDFRFDPDGGTWESIAGKSQFGVSIDDFGRRFGCSNRNPAMMTPLGLDAINRDPLLAARDAIHDVGLAAEQSRVVAAAQAWTTSNLHAGQFSAACGVFAPGAVDQAGEWLLTCEPTAYLVQRQRLERDGSVWKSIREPEANEFLASTDTWFRAVDATSGPGDSVYIVDMARAVIEHPDFMPTELKTRPDLRDGTELGRIWIVHANDEQPRLESLSSAEAGTQWLQSDSPWKRESASRFFLENDAIGDAMLKRLVADSQASVRGRARAAQVLQRRSELNDDLLRLLLREQDVRLRAAAVSWSIQRPGLIDGIVLLAEDDDALVRRQVAVVLANEVDHIEKRSKALSLAASVDDHWLHQTVASIPAELVKPTLFQLLAVQNHSADLLGHLVQRLAIDEPKSATLAVSTLLASASSPLSGDQLGILEAWLAGIRKGRHSVTKSLAAESAPTQATFARLLEEMTEMVGNSSAAATNRARCLRLCEGFGKLPENLRSLVADQSPPELRIAAMPMLMRRDNAWTRDYLNEHLTAMTSQLRRAAISACARNESDVSWLLSEISDGQLPKTVVDPATAKRWRQHSNPEIKDLATRLFQPDPNRAKIIAAYTSASKELGDPATGQKLFVEHCSACHRIDQVGTNVGPDISDTRTKTAEALLTSILDPNAAIDSSFIQYNVLTTDGRIIDGLLIDETAAGITLQQKGGKRVTVDRVDIETLQAPGVSLMPEGFEQAITQEAMSHLLSYLKNWRYLKVKIPGTLPD